MHSRWWILIGLSGVLACTAPAAGDGASGGTVHFTRDIRPILANACFACHGPDDSVRQADLRLDREAVATARLPSGNVAVVPGDVQQSELIRRIDAEQDDRRMPPPDTKRTLSNAQRKLLRQWVAEGARFDPHWAFASASRPAPPDVGTSPWAVHEIDRFVLRRLNAAGVAPSRPADRTTLVRRLSFDLRGLPPTIDEVEPFLQDDAEDSYERLVDRFLESDHFGEKLAQDWLDLARYGDTNGYHSDSHRDMWLYRDWVIHAFNTNMPFDTFVTEQIAGDLLPDATESQKIASGFNRNNTFNEEGGADPDEYLVAYAVDRTNTTGQVLLGLTIGCAQCHNHKYDPISQKEYFQLYAFFNSIAGEVGAGGENGYHGKPLPPLLTASSPLRDVQVNAANRAVEEVAERRRRAFERWSERCRDPETRAAIEAWAARSATDLPPEALSVRNGLALWLDAGHPGRAYADGATISEWHDLSGNDHHATASGQPRYHAAGLNGFPSVSFDGKHDFLRTRRGGQQLADDFSLLAVFRGNRSTGHQMIVMWGDEQTGKRRALWNTDGTQRLSFNGYSADVVGEATIPGDRPLLAHVTLRDGRISLFADGNESGSGTPQLAPFGGDAITIAANNVGKELAQVSIAEILLFERAISEPERIEIGRYLAAKYGLESSFGGIRRDILAVIGRPPTTWTESDREAVNDYFVRHVDEATRDLAAGLDRELELAEQERDRVRELHATTMVMQAMPDRRPAFVLARGNFAEPGERAMPDVPAIFPPLDPRGERNRLALAAWLVRDDNPLVARVRVNHLWKLLFGTGLVRTAGDFGIQGELPSHPMLLDWLATEFVRSGWDTKALIKKMVMSATYRQESIVRGKVVPHDPENRLLYRAPRFRLSAEEIRDAALAASGLLDRRIGGASVFPYQPASYYADKVGRKWKVSDGRDLYRRGIYTYWRRTAPYPSFILFDATSREICAVRRARTNTPLQALVTLNDPVFVEAARVLAERVLRDGGSNARTRVEFAVRRVLSRHPTRDEHAAILGVFQEQRQIFDDDRDAAAKLIAVGERPVDASLDVVELAAWTNVASVLLNLDEAITRE